MIATAVQRSALVSTARGWLGTPWHHQGRLPGIGLDCVGLPVCVARAHEIHHEDRADYGRIPDPVRLIYALAASLECVALEDRLPGDILCFEIRRGRPQHLAMITDYGMIHTHQGVGEVVEHTLADPWLSRLHSVWRYRVELV